VTAWRCPGCGCLGVAWRRAHTPRCPYGVTPEHEVLCSAALLAGGEREVAESGVTHASVRKDASVELPTFQTVPVRDPAVARNLSPSVLFHQGGSS
jgi:hypothetical protein